MFRYKAPTQIIFGKDAELEAGRLCARYGAHRVLILYGSKSAEKSGLLERLRASLASAGLAYVLLGGVVPNPLLSKVHEGIALCRQEGVDFLLAAGGGSVIDSAKAIGYGLANEGEVWDYYLRKKTVSGCCPLGVVLTIAAAGSEMSNSSVITNEEGWLKRGLSTDYCYAKFAIMNPELTYSLPAYQTASGATDIIMHTLERYFTRPDYQPLALTDGMAETLLKNVIANVKIALKEPLNYRARAEIMWSGTLSHNGVTGDRDLGDWACHQLEHELSGSYGVAHGAGLAAVWPSWARYVYKANPERFARLAANVFGVLAPTPEQQALLGISAMEDTFRSIGMPTTITELLGKRLTESEIAELAYKCSFMGSRTIGQFRVLTPDDMAAIYRMAL